VTGLAIALGLLWFLFALLTVMVVLLYRQFGLIYIGSRARVALAGLGVGKSAPQNPELEIAQQKTVWDWTAVGEGRATMAIFAVPGCDLCARLVAEINGFAEHWGELVDVLFIERGPLPSGPSHDTIARTQWLYAIDREGALHEAFDVEASPHAFVVGQDSRVLAKGIVNTRRDLEGVLRIALTDDDAAIRSQPLPDEGLEPRTYAPIREEAHV
jgi:hypothetical protein